MKNKNLTIILFIQNSKERLTASVGWFPLPIFISVGLALIITGHALLGINPRLGNPATPITFAGEKSEEGSIWISLTIKNKQVVATTFDRKIFHWSVDVKNLSELNKFSQYLKNQMQKLTINASLAKKIDLVQTYVVFATDQSLTYYHMKPILYVLASVGISNYAFEVKSPLKDMDESLHAQEFSAL